MPQSAAVMRRARSDNASTLMGDGHELGEGRVGPPGFPDENAETTNGRVYQFRSFERRDYDHMTGGIDGGQAARTPQPADGNRPFDKSAERDLEGLCPLVMGKAFTPCLPVAAVQGLWEPVAPIRIRAPRRERQKSEREAHNRL